MSDSFSKLSNMFFDKTAIDHDCGEAMEMVKNHFYNKYIKKMELSVKEHKNHIYSSPPKEIQLLNVMKQFLPENNHEEIDKMVEAMVLGEMVKSVRSELNPIHDESKDVHAAETADGADNIRNSSVHEDGIYDIDYNCLKKSDTENNNESGLHKIINLCVLYRMFKKY